MRVFKVLFLYVIAVSLVFPTVGSAASSEPIKLRLGTMVVAANPIAHGAKYFAERMHKETNGRVQIDVFTDAALGSHGQMYESMKEGVLDMCTNSPILLGPYIPEYQIYELPYIFQSREHRDAVVNGPVGEKIDKLIGELGGVKILSNFGGAPRNLITRNKKVETLNDAKGIQIRIGFGPIQKATWEDLGLYPISVSWGEAYTAFQTGVADAGEVESAALYDAKWYESLKYVNFSEHIIIVRPLLIAKRVFDKLPPDIQKLMVEIGKETTEYEAKLSNENDKIIEDKLAKNGMEFVEIKDKKEWIKATEKVRRDFIDKYKLNDIYDEILKVAEELN